ncbi:MAG: HAD family hydrolase [Spirochaetia bacterium]|nr:HAD family hydrolase [Spirochaetia bacterium]
MTEILRPPRSGFRLRYAIFDHDGTLSVLRAGWEEHMFPVMVNAILGEEKHSPADRKETESNVRSLIEYQTGMPTLLTMEMLIPMIREAGHTPENKILSPEEYKRLYHLELDRAIHKKYESIQKGLTKPEDHMMAGAFSFMETLHKSGVKLILASGSDEADVRREADLLGFSKFFNCYFPHSYPKNPRILRN